MQQAMFTVEFADTPLKKAEAFEVRRLVFTEEQGVPQEIEFDTADATSLHWLLRNMNGHVIATARLTDKGNHLGKIERVAVLREYRGQGLGRILMAQIHKDAHKQGYTSLILHAQIQCQGFYEALGYEVSDPNIFEEADIAHIKMTKSIS